MKTDIMPLTIICEMPMMLSRHGSPGSRRLNGLIDSAYICFIKSTKPWSLNPKPLIKLISNKVLQNNNTYDQENDSFQPEIRWNMFQFFHQSGKSKFIIIGLRIDIHFLKYNLYKIT